MTLVELSPDADSDQSDIDGSRETHLNELRNLRADSQPTLDNLASNINVNLDGKFPRSDNYWPNVADIHSNIQPAVKLAESNAARNFELQREIDIAISDFTTNNLELSDRNPRQFMELVKTSDRWYRSLGTLNSLHNQGERLKLAGEVMFSAVLAANSAETIAQLADAERPDKALDDLLTSLDMKVDAARDPAQDRKTGWRSEQLIDVRIKANSVLQTLISELKQNPESENKVAYSHLLYRAIKVKHGAAMEMIQLESDFGEKKSSKVSAQASEPIEPRFFDRTEQLLKEHYPEVNGFEEKYDVLVQDALRAVLDDTSRAHQVGGSFNGDLFEILSYVIAVRQYGLSENLASNETVGSYIVRFATGRQDRPHDQMFDKGKHSFDLEIVNTHPTIDKPTWHIPIQCKAQGRSNAGNSADQYDGGIVVFNLFEDVLPDADSRNSLASENDQIRHQILLLLQAAKNDSNDSLALAAGREPVEHSSDEGRRRLVAAERAMRKHVNARFEQDTIRA